MDYSTSQALTDIGVIYAIVVVVSLLVAVVIRLIVGVLSRRADQARAAASARPVAAPASAPAVTGVPPEHVVVIAAAVAAMSGTHRIVRIAPTRTGQAWTSIARSAHQTSHLPRKS